MGRIRSGRPHNLHRPSARWPAVRAQAVAALPQRLHHGSRRMTVDLTSPIGIEALDGPACPEALARATLRDIAWSNTLFGGRAAAFYGVDLLLAGAPPGHPISLLAVGAGSGHIPRFLPP